MKDPVYMLAVAIVAAAAIGIAATFAYAGYCSTDCIDLGGGIVHCTTQCTGD